MKVLFTDFDGVIVTRKQLQRRQPEVRKTEDWYLSIKSKADPDAIEQLNRVCEETGAVVVVSSTWRYVKDCPVPVEYEANSLRHVRRVLEVWGFRGQVVGVTPRLYREKMITNADGKRVPLLLSQERGKEIQAWLDNADVTVDRFAIVDDESDMAHLKHRLVQTVFDDGLTVRHADRLIQLLGKEKTSYVQ